VGPASSARRSSRAREGAPAYLALRFGWIYGPGRRRGWRDVQERIERVIAGARRIEYPDLPDPIRIYVDFDGKIYWNPNGYEWTGIFKNEVTVE